jgi:purine nucleoside permease
MKITLEFDRDVDGQEAIDIAVNAGKLSSALNEIYNLARSVLKHSDGTTKEYEEALERIKSVASEFA